MKRLFREVGAILLALFLVLVSVFTYRFFLHHSMIKNASEDNVDFSRLYRGDDYFLLNNVPVNTNAMIQKMESSLENGVPVLFGTSELTSGWSRDESKFVPYNFFKDELDLPIFAFGHAHAQTLTVLAQLSAFSNEEVRKNARFAFIISPAFFRTDGTNIESFLLYMPTDLLKKLYFESDAPEYVKVYISEYIRKHFDKIENPSFVHEYAASYALSHSSSSPLSQWKQDFYDFKLSLYHAILDNDFSNDLSAPIDEIDKKMNELGVIDWARYSLEAQEISRNISNNNPWGIKNDYFDSYVREESNNASNKIGVPIPRWQEDKPGLFWDPANYESIEYLDLKVLMEFCKTLDNKPLFIMQDLNPYAYRNYDKHNFNMRRIRELVNDYGYHYLDTWSYKEENYKVGNLVDLMHFGEYGWLSVDKAIVEKLMGVKP